ncbi:uncharacterized protein LOC120866681 [Oryx dammah]|uniref:uncharacterized protein LOC120866681 n=1 Tax=Oryx dammah TaxID=59534 RepID=UPI001A9BD51F|nr:uncharacterized protein LOC120866681 [Oryx dammah]
MSGPRPRQRRQEQRETPSRGLQPQPSPSDPVAGNSGPARRRRARPRTSSRARAPPPRDAPRAGLRRRRGAEAAGRVRASVWGLQNLPSGQGPAVGGGPSPAPARPASGGGSGLWSLGSRPATRELLCEKEALAKPEIIRSREKWGMVWERRGCSQEAGKFKIKVSADLMSGLPWWSCCWESTCQCGDVDDPWSRRIPHAIGQLGQGAATAEPLYRPIAGRKSPSPGFKK